MSRIWSYSGKTGPEFWPTLCDSFYTAAQFHWQSPIALTYDKTQPLQQTIAFNYNRQAFYVKNVNDTMHFEPAETESFVDFADKRYYLTDIHFHMPSEHIIAKKQMPLEFHLVHKDQKGQPLVCAILFSLSEDEQNRCNDDSIELTATENKKQLLDPMIFLPKNSGYFHYEGSLTTPPTDGPVQWFVFDEKGIMSRAFIEHFKTILTPNNRPLQNRNQRPIFYKESL